jgi:hypothetical protein
MVLGVDDFTQEFAYLSGRDQWLARDLVGYGTVWGLRVHEGDGDRGPEVVVEPGVAVTPRGQLIRVAPAQCAKLNDWLAINKNKQELAIRFGSDNSVDLYVVLCYRDCPTDNVPIPGEPCRSEEDSMAPSRLTDDFLLELRFDPPDQVEEDAIRSFVRWLHQIEITTDPSGFTSLEDFLKAIRDAAVGTIASPPSSNFMLDSPPISIRIHPEDICEYLRAAFRVWVTELRPLWHPAWLGMGRTCAGNPPGEEQPESEECLLLAHLRVPIVRELTGEVKVAGAGQIAVDEERRPFLIHLRMLQEWLLCRRDTAGEPAGPATNHSVLLNLDADDHPQYLNEARADIRYAPIDHAHGPGGEISDHGVLAGLGDDDHPQYHTDARGDLRYAPITHAHAVPPDPIPPHRVDAAAHNLGGDVAGPVGNARVVGLRNFPVNPPAAADAGKMLTFRTDHWALEPVSGGNPDAVEHPTGLPRYLIVAAGRILCANPDEVAPPFPVYNKLIVRRIAVGLVSLTFADYELPENNFQYIVKALPEIRQNPPPGLAVYFSRFLNVGFELRIFDDSGPVKEEVLRNIVLHIEVSKFFTA